MSPRIEAASVEEHVRLQTEKLLETADELFRKQGYRKTDMGQIAAAMSLGRSSLYRYYPNKEHILLACIQRAMTPLVESFTELQGCIDEPLPRISAWLDLQIEAATGPMHATMQMMNEIHEADAGLRQQVMALHELPAAVLRKSLDEMDILQKRDRDSLASMIMGMVQSAAMHIIKQGDKPVVLGELRVSVALVLGVGELPPGTAQ